ncbi:MAG: hypothetical protein LM564_02875 [Desulfurococcaceae archaeon]|jgi:uncharacterized coiled-coil protein SlyX|nr:hypothetical protein [Desulfurococcaceae archaeon]
MGIQITDLIKMYIRLGLQESLSSSSRPEVEKGIKELSSRLTYLEGKVALVDETLREVMRRIHEVEERLKELESPIPSALIKRSGGKLK